MIRGKWSDELVGDSARDRTCIRLSNVGELFDLDYACTGTVLDLLLC